MKSKTVRLEWLTLSVMLITHGLIIAALFSYSAVTHIFAQLFPELIAQIAVNSVLSLALIVLVTFYGSLYHEVTHGHPSNIKWLNTLLVFPCWGVLYPFFRYRSTHLTHHNDENLTDPYDDPESWYKSARDYNSCPAWFLRLLRFNNTLFGRMSLGPLLMAFGLLREEWPYFLHKDPKIARAWLFHAAGLAGTGLVLFWANMPLWYYLLVIVYPALGLGLVRSYLEHRAHLEQDQRTAIVEASWFWSLLFLNNNLHVVHHERPQVPWYALPALYRARKQDYLDKNGGYFFSSYKEIFKRYAFKAKEPVLHPFMRREP